LKTSASSICRNIRAQVKNMGKEISDKPHMNHSYPTEALITAERVSELLRLPPKSFKRLAESDAHQGHPTA
jgi:hypothetical protein